MVQKTSCEHLDELRAVDGSDAGLIPPDDSAACTNDILASIVAAQHINLCGRIFLAPGSESSEAPSDPSFTYFTVDGILSYIGFCDDFGPMSLESVYQFCQILEQQLQSNVDRNVAMRTKCDQRSLTNAVFLMGSYMIIILGFSLDEVKKSVQPFQDKLLSFRDVSPGEQNFNLYVQDCWAGLFRAKQLGWVNFGPDGFDASEYAHYDNPFNADLHEIIPGKFVAMRGPKQLADGKQWVDVYHPNGAFSHREFSPAHYVDALHHFDVQAVVRLNEPEYTKDVFNNSGIAVVDLYFEDCTTPPPDVVAKFMLIAEGLPGALAVHCKAGLGRTGTLIGLYMMAHYGFTAREAIGWMRIVRPGSVIGTQQQYLCGKEAVMRRSGDRYREAGAACALDGVGLPAVERLIADALGTVQRRLDAIRPRDSGQAVPVAAAGSSPAANSAAAGGEAAQGAAVPAVRRRRTVGSGAAGLAAHITSSSARRTLSRAASLCRLGLGAGLDNFKPVSPLSAE